MHRLLITLLFWATCLKLCVASTASTAGIEALVRRRLPRNVHDFTFDLVKDISTTNRSVSAVTSNDKYKVSNGLNCTINISGTSPSALASGLRWYLSNVVHVDIYWFIGSRLSLAPLHLPRLNESYVGASVVPWRYHFNTVTFGYTTAFWDWKDWELQLDWMALRGINLPLAWVGFEKILADVFEEAGFSEDEIFSFFSGPAFLPWNRFGNIQSSWGGRLSRDWVESQFRLNKRIVARMAELGMTPVLPCFTGFVPREIGRLYPNASFVNGSHYSTFPTQYTNDTFLEPFDPLFATLQKSFISKQIAAYGNVTHIYTLDQYNENLPYSGDTRYLQNVANNTIKSLKAVDPDAIWLLQGWLFFVFESFWTKDKINAYLGGVKNSDMLILDLISESKPQWQRTENYFGKPWIWCQLHDFGGNMGLYGQIENVTINSTQALKSPGSTMVGMGLTMEGEEGNEIMYDLLLDQAWSVTPINTEAYFHNWVTSRYHGAGTIPSGIYTAWELLRQTVYNNTNSTLAVSVPKSILELSPNTTNLVNQTGYHTTTIPYPPSTLLSAWTSFLNASSTTPTLWTNPPYLFDLTDLTRQVLANAFQTQYEIFISTSNLSNPQTHSLSRAQRSGKKMLHILNLLDTLLLSNGNPHFSLPAWIASARARSNGTNSDAEFLEYEARNQVTLWGPTGENNDYASKQWGGLVGGYYLPRWERFVEFTLNSTTDWRGRNEGLKRSLVQFEEGWQREGSGGGKSGECNETVRGVVGRVERELGDLLGEM